MSKQIAAKNAQATNAGQGVPQAVGKAQKTTLKITKGQHLKAQDLIDAQTQDASNVVATKQGQNLNLKFADGTQIEFEGFYDECGGNACSVTVAGKEAGGYTINGDSAIGAATGDGGQLVYAYGEHNSLMAMASGDAGMSSALASLGEGLVAYAPGATAAGGMGLGTLAAVGGGLAIAGGGGGGGEGGGGGAVAAGTTIVGTVHAGKVIAGNDLVVVLYRADGTQLAADARVPVSQEGQYSYLYTGEYRGVVVAHVIDLSDDTLDHHDEATGIDLDLTGSMSALGVLDGSATQLNLNINPLTTLASKLANVQPGQVTSVTPDDVRALNGSIAEKFGLAGEGFHSIVADLPEIPGGGGPGNAYGHVLAMLSGATLINGGGVEETVERLAVALSGDQSGGLDADAAGLFYFGALIASSKTGGDWAPSLISALGIDESAMLSGLSGETAQQVAEAGGMAYLTPAQIVQLSPAAIASVPAVQIAGLGGAGGQLSSGIQSDVSQLIALMSAGLLDDLSYPISAEQWNGLGIEVINSDDKVKLMHAAVQGAGSAGTDTLPELEALATAVSNILQGQGLAEHYNALGINVSGIAANGLGLLGDVIGRQSGAAVDNIVALQTLAEAARAVVDGAAGDAGPTLAQLSLLGITGVTEDNLVAAWQGIAATLDDGAEVATQAQLQDVVGHALAWADQTLSDLAMVAESNVASAAFPAVEDYQRLGLTGVSASNLDALNSVLNTVAVGGAHVDQIAKVQAIVDAYNLVLDAADGTGDGDTGASSEQYALLGVVGVTPATAALLNSAVDRLTQDKVATADLLNELAAVSNKIVALALASDGQVPNALTVAELELLGVGSVTERQAQELSARLAQSLLGEADVASVAQIDALIDRQAPGQPGQMPDGGAALSDGFIHAGEDPVTIRISLPAGSDESAARAGDQVQLLLGGLLLSSAQVDTQALADGYVSFTVTQAALGADGSKSLSAKIIDIAGNESVQTDALVVTLDRVQPTITAMEITATGEQNDLLNVGDVVTITVTLSEAVNVSGMPQLALNIGGIAVQADYAGGSGTSQLTFTYTIEAGQTDLNGIAIDADQLMLNGGSINDTAGNAASLTHASLTDNPAYQVDTTAPVVGGVAITAADGIQNERLNAGDVVTVTVTLSEAVIVTGTPQLALNIGGVTVQANYAGDASPGATLIFTYTIEAGQNDGDGIAIEEDGLTVNGGSIVDLAGNAATLAHAEVGANAQYLVDTDPVTASVTPETIANTGAAMVQSNKPGTVYLVNNSITVTALDDIESAADDQWNAVAVGSADTDMSLAASGLADGTYRVYAVDQAGNLSAASSNSVLVDSAAPEVTGATFTDATDMQNNTLNAGDTVTATVTFSEAVYVTGTPQLALDIGGSTVQATYASGHGTNALSFTYTIQSGENDLDGMQFSLADTAIYIAGGSIVDIAGNAAVVAYGTTDLGYKVDTTAPTASLASGALPRIANTAETIVQSSERGTAYLVDSSLVVNSLDDILQAADSRWNSVPVTNDSTNTLLAATGLDEGTYVVYTVDEAGNLSAPSANSIVIDNTVPTVSSLAITAETGAQNGILSVGDTVTITVTMSESVLVNGVPVLALTLDGGATVQATYAGPQNTATDTLSFTYTMQGGEMSVGGIAIGSDAIGLLVGSSIVDEANNPADLTHDAVPANADYPVDTLAPVIESVAITSASGAQNAILNAGDIVTVTVTLNENVYVTGTPQLSLDIGGATVQAAYSGGHGTSTLTFAYTIEQGQMDANGISIVQNSMQTIAASIQDAAGNDALTDFTGTTDNGDYLVDTEAPTASVVPAAVPNDGITAIVTATSSENGQVYLVDSTLAVSTLDDIKNAADNRWNEANVSAANVDPNLPTVGLIDGSYRVYAVDEAGNLSAPSDDTVTVDSTAPNVSAVAITGAIGVQNGVLNEGDVVTVTVTMSENVYVTDTPQLRLRIGNELVNAIYTGPQAVATATLSFTYTILAGQADIDGITIEENGLTLNGSSIADAAGNAAVLDHNSEADNAQYQVDTTSPTVALTSAALPNTSAATVQSSEVGEVYLVNASVSVASLSNILAAADNLWNKVGIDTPSNDSALNASGLVDGIYHAYSLDLAGNLSAASTNSVTIDSTAPTLTITDNKGGYVSYGDVVTYTFTFSEAVTGFGADDITVTGGAKGAFTDIGNNQYTLQVSPNFGQGTLSVNVKMGAASDLAGNLSAAAGDNSQAYIIPEKLNLGNVTGNGNVYQMNLILGVVEGGNYFYYLDRNGDGLVDPGDCYKQNELDNIFNSGADVTISNRSRNIGDFVVSQWISTDGASVLTQSRINAGWVDSYYWAGESPYAGHHYIYSRAMNYATDDTGNYYAAVQVQVL